MSLTYPKFLHSKHQPSEIAAVPQCYFQESQLKTEGL